MRTIHQFMWGYQDVFRVTLEFAVKCSLDSIGVNLAPIVLLVGFQEEPGGYEICVEPERRGVAAEVFAACADLGDAAYENHPDRKFLITDAGQGRRFHDGLRDRCRADSIAQTLDAHPDHRSRRWFAGNSARVGRYRVYPVIGVLRDKWDALPTLSERKRRSRVEMSLSLQEAVLREALSCAGFALSATVDPVELWQAEGDEIVRRAAKNFVNGIVFANGTYRGGSLFSAMNLVAAQPYEGRAGAGSILMGAPADYSLVLAFDSPIGLGQTRALRKALEMTDPRLHLVTDGHAALGVGTLNDHYESDKETAFHLRVLGRGSWELEHAGQRLLAVADGRATVPRERLDRSTFADAVERLFGADGDVAALWELASAASGQPHGTMLVIHAQAEAEVSRLAPPAMQVTPVRLEEATVLAVSAIDGAIIVDPGGHCHAVGAILDGRAAPDLGDASRGARFNSAHRYLKEAGAQCLIVIVSEDGMLNLIPDLPRRVKKSYVENVLAAVESLADSDPVDFEAFHEREDHLRSIAFYLSPEQCRRGNQARERVEQSRGSASGPPDGLGRITRIGYTQLTPDPALDDSYFIPEG